MKTIGLIGGTSWVSTIGYHRIINQLTNERLGGLNSAKILLYSINFEEFKPTADPDGLVPVADTLTGIACALKVLEQTACFYVPTLRTWLQRAFRKIFESPFCI